MMKMTKKNLIIIFTILMVLSFLLVGLNRFQKPENQSEKLSEAEELQQLKSERAEFFENYYQEHPEEKCQERIEVFYNTLTHYWQEKRWDYINSYLIPASQAYDNQATLYEQMINNPTLPEVSLSFDDIEALEVVDDLCTAQIELQSYNDDETEVTRRLFTVKLRLINDEFFFEEINLLNISH